MASQAQNRATIKYTKNNYYIPKVYIPKELEADVKEASNGSVSDFIKQALFEKMKSMGYDVPNS